MVFSVYMCKELDTSVMSNSLFFWFKYNLIVTQIECDSIFT